MFDCSICIALFSTLVTQPGMQLPFQILPSVNRIHQGAISLPFSESQPLMVLPSTERNQAVARLPQGQMWHPGMIYTQPAPTMQNVAQQMSSTAPPAAIPVYNAVSASTPSRHITEAIPGLIEKRPQISVDDVTHVKYEPSAKRTKHESTSSYKPVLDQPLVCTH